MENAINLESLSSELQFTELGRRVGKFVLQHPHVEIVRFKSAITALQRRLAGQDRELYHLAEATGRAKVEQDAQLEGLREAIDEVAKKQLHERKKVSGLQEAMGEMRSQISQTDEVVEQRIGPLEQAALELAETKIRTSQVESGVADLRAAMADNSAKVEEVLREVVGLRVQFFD
jgi:chromosome segregation ATPase